MANAVRTVFQNSDTVLWLTRSLPSVNKLFLVRYIGSLPVMVIEALRERFNTSIGPKRSLIDSDLAQSGCSAISRIKLWSACGRDAL